MELRAQHERTRKESPPTIFVSVLHRVVKLPDDEDDLEYKGNKSASTNIDEALNADAKKTLKRHLNQNFNQIWSKVISTKN